MRIGLIGSVDSSLLTLQKLIEHTLNVVGVWGYEPHSIKNISGYTSLKSISEENCIPYYSFINVNDDSVKNQIRKSNIELLFVVGLSQLIDESIISGIKYGCVGFHPTKLPKGRGRAPLAWLVLNEKEGAASFFKIDSGTDSGDIYIQEPFEIDNNDDAFSVSQKLKIAMSIALDKWLPILKKGYIKAIPQDESKATYYGRRAPLDGIIDWCSGGYFLDRLIKATSSPHPGAFSFYEDYKVVINKSEYIETGFPIGVIGRVVDFSDNCPIVQTGKGYICIKDYKMFDYKENLVDKKLVIGSRLGYYEQNEIFKLRNQIIELKEIIYKLKNE